MTYEKVITDLKLELETYKAARIEKIKNYEERLARHNRTFDNHVWIMRAKLKANKKKQETKLVSYTFAEAGYNKSFLFLDCIVEDLENKYSIKNYTLKEFLELKIKSKRIFKKLIKNYQIIAPLVKASIIMKSLSKPLNKIGKAPIFLSDLELSKKDTLIFNSLTPRTQIKLLPDQVVKKNWYRR